MADYKRIVSYMYNYEKGIKRNNIGYARIDGRNGQCKIVVNIKTLSIQQSILKTYLFRRTENRVKYIYIGDITIKSGIGEMRINTNMNNIMNSSYTIDDIAGVVVYSSKDKYFATEWDDKPIIIKDLVEMLRDEHKREMEKALMENADNLEAAEDSVLASKIEQVQNLVDGMNKEIGNDTQNKEEKAPETTFVEGSASCKNKSEQDPLNYQFYNFYEPSNHESCRSLEAEESIVTHHTNEPIPVIEFPEDPLQYEEETVIMEELAEQISTISEEQEQRREYQQRRIQDMIAKKEQERKIRERNERNRARGRNNRRNFELYDSEKDRMSSEQADEVEDPMQPEQDVVQKDWNYSSMNHESQESSNQEDINTNANIEEEQKQSANSEAVAARIFAKFPKMQPFDENDFVECVRFEPQDIGMLPMENWVLGNNSFLLHGYYSYRHLIFAKKIQDGRTEYMLGIPGMNRQREMILAKMFGFEKFQPVSQSDGSNEGFGYWYTNIAL